MDAYAAARSTARGDESFWRRRVQPSPLRPFVDGAPYSDRHDMATFGGRARFYYDVMAPDQMVVGARDVADANALLALSRSSRSLGGEAAADDETLWNAARTSAYVADGRGGLIPPPFRVSGWALCGSAPVSVLIATARSFPTSTPLFAFGHWLNQTHLAAVSYYNRPPGRPPADAATLGVAYGGAIASALGVVVGWKALAARVPALGRAGIFAPYPAAAAANMVNTAVIRGDELATGIDVEDSSGAVVGRSKIAAQAAIADTCVTRLVLPAGNFILTPIVFLALERLTPLGRLLARRPGLGLPAQVACTVACFAAVVPAAVALYPPVVSVKAADLEPEIAARVPPGAVLRYNKGV